MNISVRHLLADAGARLRPAIERGVRWWVTELVALFPPSTLNWLKGADREQICLVREIEGGVECELRSLVRGVEKRTFKGMPLDLGSVQDWLATKAKSAPSPFVLVLPADRFFERTFTIPDVALASLPEISAAEFERHTPFRASEIFHSETARVSERNARQRDIVQTVVKRRFVQDASERLGIPSDLFVSVASDQALDDPARYVALRASRAPSRSPVRAMAGMTAVALLLIGAACGVELWRQSAEERHLAEEIAKAKAAFSQADAKASGVRRQRALYDQVQRLKGETRFVEIWRELTRLLPDGAWLSDMQLDEATEGREVLISGFAPGAADLVRIVGNSELFERVSLAAAVISDPVERKERFALRMRLRTQGSLERKT